jgi:hypothetical protein
LKHLTVLAAALMMAMLAGGMIVGVVAAQTSTGAEVYEACLPGRAQIKATDLPQVVDQDRCPLAGRVIADSAGVGTHLPPTGWGVFVEAYRPDGTQVLTVRNLPDGTFEVHDVGLEPLAASTNDTSPQTFTAQAIPNGCNDSGHDPDPASQGVRIIGEDRWRFNASSTPGDMSAASVEDALQRAGTNVSHVQNPCGIGDGVGAELHYSGRTTNSVNIPGDRFECPSSGDGRSVVGFGNLARQPDGSRALALTCRWDQHLDGYTQDDIYEADTRLNKGDGVDWTVRITSSCSGRYDVEGLMTHERGHHFGMNHVREDLHPYQTMSAILEGPCQGSERSLGRGDAQGLNEKYP